MLCAVFAGFALPGGDARVQTRYTPPELEQLLAPIALYPDAILAPVRMAAADPAGVRLAADWLGRSPTSKDKGVAESARRLGSCPGKCDGLYWDTAPGEPASPLGRQPVRAAEGARSGTPFRGVLFRGPTAQGPAARGGAMDDLSEGRLLRAFAAIATPAAYGRSGLRTFIVDHDGRVYSRDLGPHTRTLAARISSFDPAAGWKREDRLGRRSRPGVLVVKRQDVLS